MEQSKKDAYKNLLMQQREEDLSRKEAERLDRHGQGQGLGNNPADFSKNQYAQLLQQQMQEEQDRKSRPSHPQQIQEQPQPAFLQNNDSQKINSRMQKMNYAEELQKQALEDELRRAREVEERRRAPPQIQQQQQQQNQQHEQPQPAFLQNNDSQKINSRMQKMNYAEELQKQALEDELRRAREVEERRRAPPQIQQQQQQQQQHQQQQQQQHQQQQQSQQQQPPFLQNNEHNSPALYRAQLRRQMQEDESRAKLTKNAQRQLEQQADRDRARADQQKQQTSEENEKTRRREIEEARTEKSRKQQEYAASLKAQMAPVTNVNNGGGGNSSSNERAPSEREIVREEQRTAHNKQNDYAQQLRQQIDDKKRGEALERREKEQSNPVPAYLQDNDNRREAMHQQYAQDVAAAQQQQQIHHQAQAQGQGQRQEAVDNDNYNYNYTRYPSEQVPQDTVEKFGQGLSSLYQGNADDEKNNFLTQKKAQYARQLNEQIREKERSVRDAKERARLPAPFSSPTQQPQHKVHVSPAYQDHLNGGNNFGNLMQNQNQNLYEMQAEQRKQPPYVVPQVSERSELQTATSTTKLTHFARRSPTRPTCSPTNRPPSATRRIKP